MRFLSLLGAFGAFFSFRRNRQFQRLQEAQYQEVLKRREEEKKKVEYASRLLKGRSWRDPDGKEDFISEVYGDKVPGYLWYSLGKTIPDQEDCEVIRKFFWGNEEPCFGDLEVHPSSNPEVGLALRIRKAKALAIEIQIGKERCPLYQIGYSFFGTSQGGPVASFTMLYPPKEQEAVA